MRITHMQHRKRKYVWAYLENQPESSYIYVDRYIYLISFIVMAVYYAYSSMVIAVV